MVRTSPRRKVAGITTRPTKKTFSITRWLSGVVTSAFGHAWGSLFLLAFIIQAYTRKRNFRKLNTKEKEELAQARDDLWNLNKQPFGLSHRFATLNNGKRLHYVLSTPETTAVDGHPLVIFIHGFPDSWYLWNAFLQSKALKASATMVAVDLPGYGGSESLASSSAQVVLEAVSEFILKIREQYHVVSDDGKDKPPVVIVGHDWGAIIAFRLASEAPALADRFILSNGVHPPLFKDNCKDRLDTASRMFKTWTHSPTNFRPLREAIGSAKPLISQGVKSGYIFVFNLPRPLVALLGRIGDFWILRLLNAFSESFNPKEPIRGRRGFELLASSVGPGLAEIDHAKQVDFDPSLTYPPSIRHRASSGSLMDKIGVYRDGLLWKRWEKSLETLWELSQLEQQRESSSSSASGSRRRSSSRVGLFELGPPGSMRAPVTVLWGQDDVAIENALALEGMGDYFGMHGSNLVRLAKCGHWVPLVKHGVDAWERVILWAVTGESGALKEELADHAIATVVLES